MPITLWQSRGVVSLVDLECDFEPSDACHGQRNLQTARIRHVRRRLVELAQARLLVQLKPCHLLHSNGRRHQRHVLPAWDRLDLRDGPLAFRFLQVGLDDT